MITRVKDAKLLEDLGPCLFIPYQVAVVRQCFLTPEETCPTHPCGAQTVYIALWQWSDSATTGGFSSIGSV